jgi:diguanylate cyclase (GGDEF)-like protein
MINKGYAHLVKPFITTLILLFLYGALHFSSIPFFTIAQLKTQDTLLRIKHFFSHVPNEVKEIAIVSIDDSAYDQYGGKWPWGREAFAALIYNISKDSPKVIGLNLAFLGISERQEIDDQILQLAFKDAGNIVGASYFGADGIYVTPNEYFASSLKDYGFTNKPVDIDNTIRLTKFFEPIQSFSKEKAAVTGVFDYNIEIKLLAAYYGIEPEDISYYKKIIFHKDNTPFLEIPSDPKGLSPVNYTANSHDLNIIPVLNVLYNKAAPNIFTDKIVLVGTKGKIFHEEIMTPLGTLSGVEIIANSLIMVLSKNFITVLPFGANAAIILIIMGLLSFMYWRYSIIKNALIFFTSLFLYFLCCVILTFNNIRIDFFAVFILLLISYISIEAVKYIILLTEEMKLKNMATQDAATGLSTRRFFMFQLENDIKNSLHERRNLSVALFFIDNYDTIAQGLNPDKAEAILKKVGQLIKKSSRKTRSGDFIARYSEASFSIILRNTASAGAYKYTQRIKSLLEKIQAEIPGRSILLTVSAGITPMSILTAPSAFTLMKHAEYALKQALQESSNRIYTITSVLDSLISTAPEHVQSLDESALSFVAEELNAKNKELQALISKLRSTYAEMAQNVKLFAMGKLASTIHHELNNPLSALRTCFQTIQKTLSLPPDETAVNKVSGLVAMALEEIERLIEMNKGLKDLYRPAKIVLEPVQINYLLNEILLLVKSELNKKRIETTVQFDDSIQSLPANAGDLKQVFLNIIFNAAEAMPQGGKLSITTRNNASEKKVEITVADTGCGISPDNISKIFEPLFTTKEGKGAGLGLYVTKQKIEQLNGNIKVVSELNKGTTFIITLPQ